jgi:hypothetical protein
MTEREGDPPGRAGRANDGMVRAIDRSRRRGEERRRGRGQAVVSEGRGGEERGDEPIYKREG